MRRAVLTALMAVGYALPIAAIAQLDADSPWPKWAHDNMNTGPGVVTGQSPDDQKSIQWIWPRQGVQNPLADYEYTDQGAVISADGRLYTTTTAGRLICLYTDTGTSAWTDGQGNTVLYDTGKDEDASTPMLVEYVPAYPEGPEYETDDPASNYAVLFGCGDTLYCVANIAGAPVVQWTRQVANYFFSSCGVIRSSDGRTYWGLQSTNPSNNNGKIVAISKTGSLVWSLELDTYNGSSQLVRDQVSVANLAMGDDGTIYASAQAVTERDGALYAITDNGSTGSVKWRTRPSFTHDDGGYTQSYGSPCVIPESDYIAYPVQDWNLLDDVTTHSGGVFVLSDTGSSASQEWFWHEVESALMGAVESSPVPTPDGYLWVGTWALGDDQNGDTAAGRFIRMKYNTAEVVYTSDGDLNSSPAGEANIDMTACIAMDDEENVLAIFTTDEDGVMRKFDADGDLLWDPTLTVQRTDRISLAMDWDGVVYFCSRGDANNPHGYIYAVTGFDP